MFIMHFYAAVPGKAKGAARAASFSHYIGAPFRTIKISSESSRLIEVEITVKHGGAP